MKRDRHSGKILDGRYELIRLIDEGGMGAVYLGKHTKLGRKAAVKFLHAELTANKDTVERFYREAHIASSIEHPNIINVFDVGVSEWGEPYLVMEYLSGENLGRMLKRRGVFTEPEALGIMESALKALAAAHEQGIVHRDLKPENIFMVKVSDSNPIVKIIDFGISKAVQDGQPQLTKTGALLGTPSYMSPEQARGRGEFDHRTDVYSMGVILYLMLTGDHPFVGQSYNDLIFNILTESPRDPISVKPEFPKDIVPIVFKSLEKNPEERYSDCHAFLSDLEKLPAFALRQDALIALGRDIADESFATGDLGEVEESPVESNELAATVFAKVGGNGYGSDASGNGNVVSNNVEWIDQDKAKSDSENQASERIPWDTTIPSRIPPPHSTKREKGGFSFAWIMIIALLFAAGAAIVLGLDMAGFAESEFWGRIKNTTKLIGFETDTEVEREHHNKPNTALISNEIETVTDSAKPEIEAVPSGKEIATVRNNDTLRTSEQADLKAEPANTANSESAASPNVIPDQESLNQKSTDPVSDEQPVLEEAPVDVNNPTNKEIESGDQNQKLPDIIPNPVGGGSKSTKPKVSESEKKNDKTNESELNHEPNEEPQDDKASSAGTTLTSKKLNSLVNTKASRIQNCYDTARLINPSLEGKLVILVGMGGDDVYASILRNEVTAELGNCVKRQIQSIVPPPNDGKKVEIEKEYNFVISD